MGIEFGATGGEKQPLGVGVFGRLSDCFSWAGLHDFSVLHDQDAVGEISGCSQVVRHEQYAHSALFPNAVQCSQEPHANREIEHRGGFIGDEKVESSQGSCDGDSLLLAP